MAGAGRSDWIISSAPAMSEKLLDCAHNGKENHKCDHSEDMGIASAAQKAVAAPKGDELGD